MKTTEMFEKVLLALCIWREARNQSRLAKLGVKWSILNRVAKPKGPYIHCTTITQMILCPEQFSSFNANNPEARLIPDPKHADDFAAFIQCCEVVDCSDPDPTNGSTHYYDVSIQPPYWATPANFKASIDAFRFHQL